MRGKAKRETATDHGPVEDEYVAFMDGLVRGIDKILNGDKSPKGTAFVLLIAKFGDIEGGRVNYGSNAHREDMLAMMKEMIARAEGRYGRDPGHA